MRMLVTVVVEGQPHDVAVDVEQDGVVADLQTALAAQFPAVVAGTRPSLTLVRESSPATAPTGPPPDLYLGHELLDPAAPLQESAVRHGAIIGLREPIGNPLHEPDGLVEIRVTGGADSGQVVRWDPGQYTVGSDPASDLVLDDPSLPAAAAVVTVSADARVQVEAVSGLSDSLRRTPQRFRPLRGPVVLHDENMPAPVVRRRRWWHRRGAHASAGRVLPEGTQTVDPNEPAPLIHLERRPLRGLTTWHPDETLSVGSRLLHLAHRTAPDASLSPSPSGATLDFNRPPRLLPPDRRTHFTLPPEPQRSEKVPFPLLMMLIPVAMGGGMYMMTKSPYSLLIIALSPLMALGGYSTQRRMNKTRYATDMKTWTERMKKIQSQALDGLVEERTARRRDFADPGEVLMMATGPRARLWERRPTDPDWLAARLGTADQVSDVQVKDPELEEHEGSVEWTAPDVPVTVGLRDAGVTGIAGPRAERMALARWVVAQTAVLHSPTQLSMVMLTTRDAEDEWSWVRWMPHLRSDPGDSELAHIGTDDQTWARRIGELSQLMAARAAAAKGGGFSQQSAGGLGPPVLVVLDGSRALRLIPGMITLLQEGPRLGILFLCLDDDARLLPEECQAVVNLGQAEDGPVATVTQTGKPAVEEVRLDLVTAGWAERVARSLAPVRDVTDGDESSTLPGSSRLLDVLGIGAPDPEVVLQRWQQVGRTTEAVIGEAAEGPFAIDIRTDGPHGLVAGTTGSGKSELLQTIIASLAVYNRPDEMNFVLVDYKGGAAFKDCNRLPHTVGMVTDLDGHLTTRALESLGAELRRREHQLAGADAKDIEDYLATKGPDDEPMPRLLIVIDEFAALVAELPDFVTGLVDIARRGRSLGVHLILATQRPAGVVSAEIKSNTNLRIALRVTDPTDSDDVLESPVAAQIMKSTPGRAYARLGHSSLTPFQSARVGGRPRGADTKAGIALRRMAFGELGTPVDGQVIEAEEDATVPSDLASLVVAMRQASEQSGVTSPPPPWLPALPEVVTLDELLDDFSDAVPTSESLKIPFGLADVPREQRRDVAAYDLAHDGHLSIVGANRSGRSYVLRAIAGSIGRLTDPRDVHIYGVDCGNNALLPLVGLPHTGAVVTRDQVDRMGRLLRRLQDTLAHRQQQLAVQGYADIAEQRANVDPDERLPYLVVLFDRWEGFYQAYESIENGRIVDGWMQILQEGAGVGIKMVVSGDRSLTVGRVSTLLEDKVMLRMLDPQEFSLVGLGRREVPDTMVDGRAFRAQNGAQELQTVLHGPDPSGTAQVAALQQISREAKARYADVAPQHRPFRLDILPPRVTITEARALGNEMADTLVPMAVGGDTLELKGLDALKHGPGLLVTGGRGTGRSTTLLSVAELQLESGWDVVLFTPRISPLRDLVGRPGVHGYFTPDSDRDEVEELLTTMAEVDRPNIVVVDDLELIDIDSWLAEALDKHLEALRDTGSVLLAAGSPVELSSQYRGLASSLKRSGSGIMLAPQSSSDTDMFNIMIPRSSIGLTLPPGGGYLVRAGQYERVQVVVPD
ncbi:FtsK/SpoIIIE domain-containing protein [Luteipulveratus mongoliensis]|uniref:Cell division-like protein n=1 Tax=Luteipulveratus mongoliensis TaxID=571913 RepID=A0A0K1JMW4_9MICO|nr:FtsK/SpoIIIE domain-containing protein [Luteipulveratus mongoliensis]AKU18062.1 cell division-like protein [Luteipulveratus mongoliensis]